MNRLRRMVLVNSANVRYREVELDGHIHFIGTQGTGKSTLLRALLFFYNADSRKLGISKEKKSFADYYFPYADSYIFYEVQAGARCFCVWLYKRQNRLCFRFMDGGYDRELVIDGSAARGEADLMAKAAQLGLKVERALHNFTEYRDILYGENRAMRRYALLQGISNYSTIPRTISNIFLNANLDGGYIKKTIIDSLSDDAVEINLETNRHHLETARSHYADVSEYLQRENQAEQITVSYQSVLDLEERQRETAWKIGAAFNRSRELKRGLEEQIAVQENEHAIQRKKLKEIQAQYDTEKRRLGDRLAEAKKDITRANEKKRHYEKLGIDALLQEAEDLPGLEQELKHYREQHRMLTAKTERQEEQFNIAVQKLENECQGHVQQFRAELSDFKDDNREQRDVARKQFEKQAAGLELDFEESCGGLRAEVAQAEHELKEQDLELRRLDHTPLFVEEQKQLGTQAQALEQQRIRLEEEQKQNQSETAAQEREAEDRLRIEKNEGENRLRPLKEERAALTAQLVSQKEELERLSGSLVEFLDNEVAGWHETIGKTVRRDVLLQSGLEPKQVDGRSLFGVELQLEHLEPDALSKSSIEAAQVETEMALTLLAGTLEKQLDANRAAEDRLIQKYNRKIKELRGTGKTLSVDLFSAERDLERNAIATQNLSEKVSTKRQQLQSEIEKNGHEIRTRLKELKTLIAERTTKHATAIKRVSGDLNRRTKLLDNELQQRETICATRRGEQEQRLVAQKSQLEIDRKAVLEKAGIDASKVAILDEQIHQQETRLKRIRQHETVRIEYAQNKREWIDKLPEFQALRAQLQEKMDHQAELFERRIQNERKRLDEISAVLTGRKDALQEAMQEIRAFEGFEHEDLFLTFESFIRHHDSGDASDGRDRIAELQGLALKFEKQFKQMTERIAAFAGVFSEGNCLGFEVHLAGEASFRSFAEVLAAFVREQKIITLKTEVTKKYSMVLNTIVNETNRLLQREGEVQRIIQKINSDFRASNFVGVVHSIEMRLQASSNRIFQVLREICLFQAENHLNFGEIDLFNCGDSGNDEKAVELLDQLRIQMSQTKNTTLRLEDALDLEFRVCENENDTNWVNRLANVGSNGTDVLVKSMIYINLLNIFKTGSRKQGEPAQLHCLVDEVGILHDSNVKSLIQFAAERSICMINGSPNSHNEQDYKHIYIFRKENRQTAITKLISHAS